jgi:hypothetical protein
VKSVLVLASFVLLTAAAFILVWLNRTSEKILTAVIPVGAAGLIAIYFAVFVFGGEAIYDAAEIDQRLGSNGFEAIHSAMVQQLSVPPATEILIQVPQGNDPGRIVLKNSFCTVSIVTQLASWMRGTGGIGTWLD